MLVPYQYSYLVGTIVFLAVWVVLFYVRRDLRKEMLFFSFWIAILSFCSGLFWWTKDWWLPPTMTGTIVGIEDFLVGFGSGGAPITQSELSNAFLYLLLVQGLFSGLTIGKLSEQLNVPGLEKAKKEK